MLNVQISTTTIGPFLKYEYIRPSSWIKYMDEHQQLHRVFGTKLLEELAPTLRTFWARYELQCPGHLVFQKARAGLLSLEQTLPIYLHADEGRTLKKKPLFLIQFQMCFGKGAGKKNTQAIIDERMKDGRLQPNMKGSSLTTRFLCGLMLRSDYADNPQNLHDLLGVICEDLQMLGEQGVLVQGGKRLFMAPLGNKGDWDYLAKVARLTRSYRNAPKCPTSQTPDKPMCHLCMAGSPGLPYEDV